MALCDTGSIDYEAAEQRMTAKRRISNIGEPTVGKGGFGSGCVYPAAGSEGIGNPQLIIEDLPVLEDF